MRRRGLFREDMDQKVCGDCGDVAHEHDPMVLRPRCHPGSPVIALYAAGCIVISCHECGKVACGVEVASREASSELAEGWLN